MQTTAHRSTLIRHALTLLLGAVLAVGIWLVGSVELSWLGFACAAMLADTPRGRGALTRCSRS